MGIMKANGAKPLQSWALAAPRLHEPGRSCQASFATKSEVYRNLGDEGKKTWPKSASYPEIAHQSIGMGLQFIWC